MSKPEMRGAFSMIFLVNKSTVAIEAYGLLVRPVLFKVSCPYFAPLVSSVRRGRVRRMSRLVDILGSPRVMFVSPPFDGVRSSVMNFNA